MLVFTWKPNGEREVSLNSEFFVKVSPPDS